MEKLYKEKERYQEDLADIHMNYDLNSIEEKFKSAKRTEDWAEAFIIEQAMCFNAIESFLQCTICQK